MEKSPATLWSPGTLPLLSQPCNSCWVHCAEQSTPGNSCGSPTGKTEHWNLCKCSYPCVSPAPLGVGGTKQMCWMYLQRCVLGGVGIQPLAGHKFTPRFYLLYHRPSNAGFLHVILNKDLDLVIFPKSFPLFSIPCGSHSTGHCLGSARLLALTLPAHHSPSWKESLCSQEINRNQYQELSFSINTVPRK